MKKGLRRVAVVAVSTLVAIPAMAAVASANSSFAFDRVAGSDRFVTSVATAKVFGNSSSVILASGVQGHFPDALAASYLAGRKSAPVMLTTLDSTPAMIAAQIAASGATNVYLVGGTGVISAAQEASLATKYTVKRLGGSDRFATAAAVIADGGTAASTTAVLATGLDFPDALGGGALSYAKGMPMAITQTNALPDSTLKALKDAGVTNVIVLGGPTVISANVITALTAASITSTRIFGADRAETSSKLADYEITSQGFSNTAVNVASGARASDGVDALGGAALSGKEMRPLLITDNQSLVGPGVEAFLVAHSATLTTGHIFGGIGAVTAAAEAIMTTDARGTAAAGSIAFASATVAQGGTLAGTVANAASISNIAVAGCGITNANVPVSSTGTISLLVPASQAAGACSLVFTITKVDGTTSTQTIPVTVTATPMGVTAAPDLISATIVSGTNNVTYTFDAPLATVSGVTFFHVYDAAGTESNPTVITSSGSTVTAQFADLSTATTATVDLGAVKDASLRSNPINALPLQTITLAIGETDAPDLVSVGNPTTNLGFSTFDFTFDAPVAVPALDDVTAKFFVVSTDGTQYVSSSIKTVSVDKKTLGVAFTSLVAAGVPTSQVVRGVAESGAVADSTGLKNPLEVAKVGTAASTAPDLLSVTVVGTNVVRYTFDQSVACTAAGQFKVFNSSAAETAGNTCAAVNANAAAVDVTFTTVGAVANAVGANVATGGVTGTTGSLQVNARDELGLQSVTYQAGRTAKSDLVSVVKSTDAFGVTTVKYAFDDAIPTTVTLVAGTFVLYDATGAQFVGGGTWTFSTDRKTVTVTGGFTAAQLSAAIIGAVDAHPGADAAPQAFPEGAANVS